MENLNTVFFYQLEKAIKTYRQFAQSKIKEGGFDITVDQWLVLKSLSDHPDVTQNELAEMVFKDKASITRIIDLLVDAKYIKRSAHDESRRRFKLSITDKGHNIIKELQVIVTGYRKKALKNILDKDTVVADKVLKAIINNCSEK